MSQRTLPAKDKSIAAAAFVGEGREVEYRIEGNPGLVLVLMAPKRDGLTARVWRVYYSAHAGGRRTIRKVRLGPYPAVTLAEARRRAIELRQAVDRGLDPVAEVEAKRAEEARASLTFADLVAEYIAHQREAGIKTIEEVERALMADAVPHLGAKRANEITDVEIEAVVDRVAKRGSRAMARHLLVYLRGVYRFGLRHSPTIRKRFGLVMDPSDAVGRGTRGRAGKYGKPPVDDRYLDDAEIVAFWRALDASGAEPQTKIALRLSLLTGQRVGELLGTEWRHVKLDSPAPEWILPGVLTKNGLPHAVPLVPDTAALFTELRSRTGTSNFAFPSEVTGTGTMSTYTPRQCVQRMFERGLVTIPKFKVKDLRTTVKTGLARLGVMKEIRDSVQNHKPTGVGDINYNFHTYQEEKRAALQLWTDHVMRLVRKAN